MTLSEVEQIAAATPSVPATVDRLRATYRSRRTRPAAWRVEQLEALERLLTERESEFVAAIQADLGRNATDAWLADVAPTVGESKYARKHLRSWMRPGRVRVPLAVQPGRAWYQYEPLGVVTVIGAWNYPIYLTLGPLVGALAAGNCVVLKPSEHTPEVSRLMARLIPQYLDPDAVAVVEGGAAETQELLEQGLDHCFYTGGPEIAKKVMATCAKHLTPVTLELGGKSPAIVAADADIKVAARRIAWGKLLNSGQTCIAPDHVLVERPVRDQFVAELTKAIDAMSLSPDLPLRTRTPHAAHRGADRWRGRQDRARRIRRSHGETRADDGDRRSRGRLRDHDGRDLRAGAAGRHRRLAGRRDPSRQRR